MSQHPPLPTDGEKASKTQNSFDASNNRIGMAGNGSSEHPIDGQGTDCPYHSRILQEPKSHRAKETSSSTLEQFMIHHPGEQYALFNRPDNEKTSIYRECICWVMGDTFGSTETEYKFAEEETDLSGFQVGL